MITPSRVVCCVAIAFAAVVGSPAAENAEQPNATAAPVLPDSEPSIKTRVAPEFPATLPSTVTQGSAVTRIIVDDHGAITAARVLKASDPAFGEAALAAVKQWQFSAGVDHGKYTAMCLDVPFQFDRAKSNKGELPMGNLSLVPLKRAALQDAPLGDYPESLSGRGLQGQVIFACVVNPDGTASGLRVLRASHADYVVPAIVAAKNWRFTPATQGDLTIASELRGEVYYTDTKTPPRDQVLAANGITAPDGSQPEAAPQPAIMADPVFPYDLLLKGQSGSAAVEFTVAGNGVVRDVHVREATQSEFGAALAAAVETWLFSPAMVHGMGVDVKLLKRAEFKGVPADAKSVDGDWASRLVPLVRENALKGGAGLDGRIVPLYRVPPVRPSTLADDAKAQAVIEFVIDRDGRARLPRIVSASDEAVGWAAATAIGQWVFSAPTRGGQPTEVKVQVPVAF
jgi:TonB family protein